MNFAWKCWRDTRMLCGVSLATAMAAQSWFVYTIDLRLIAPRAGMMAAAAVATILCASLGLLLGATLGGREFGGEAIHFILTRPQRRAPMVWTAWIIGLLELTTATGAFVLYAWAICGLRGQGFTLREFVFQQHAPQVLLAGWLIYSLGYALTVTTRREGVGAALTAVLCIGYGASVDVLSDLMDIRLPFICDVIAPLPLAASLAIWFAVDAAFVLAAQVVVEWREA